MECRTSTCCLCKMFSTKIFLRALQNLSFLLRINKTQAGQNLHSMKKTRKDRTRKKRERWSMRELNCMYWLELFRVHHHLEGNVHERRSEIGLLPAYDGEIAFDPSGSRVDGGQTSANWQSFGKRFSTKSHASPKFVMALAVSKLARKVSSLLNVFRGRSAPPPMRCNFHQTLWGAESGIAARQRWIRCWR